MKIAAKFTKKSVFVLYKTKKIVYTITDLKGDDRKETAFFPKREQTSRAERVCMGLKGAGCASVSRGAERFGG